MLPATTALLVLSALIVPLAGTSPSNGDAEPGSDSAYITEEVSFENDGLTLHGTVLVPSTSGERGSQTPPATTATSTSAAPRHPAVVIVAGSGVRPRSDYLAEARAFAASGVVTLIYDKRTVGYSLTERSYEQLGDDAVAALRVLRDRADVDPARIGLWGHSEGGWVVPTAAASHSEVGFVILAGASARPPAEVQSWSTCRYLVNSGFADRMCAPLGGNLTRLMVAGGLFPEAAFDPLPALRRLRVPTLAVLAQFDQSTAPVTSERVFTETLTESPRLSVCVVPGADHEFHASSNGFEVEERYANGYLELAPAWVAALDGAAFDCPTAARAQQIGAPTPLRSLDWFESLPVHAAAGIAMLGAFLSYPMWALVRRMRGRRIPGPAARSARLLSAAGLVTVLGTVCLLGYLMATGATDPIGPVLLDRPAIWLLLQALTLTVVGAAIWTAITWWRHRDTVSTAARIRLGSVLAGAIVFVPWAAWWGLFTV
ncbi:alpha/beta hydrolase family protein [Agromyces bauzanensis]